MRFVIVGNGVAGATAALALRQREPKALITLIGAESDYFYSRTALMYAYMDRMSLRDLEPLERKVYDKQSIRRVRDRVTDLDARARTVTLKSGAALGYDGLLLATGSAPNRMDWPGMSEARDGVVFFVGLEDLRECERLTPSSKEAVVVGGGLIGVELAECLAHHRIRTAFLVREPFYWPAALFAEEGAMVSEHIRRRGVEVVLNEEVGEVACDGAGRVARLKGSSGREYACQMLGVAIGVRPAVDWLRAASTPPDLNRGILVSPGFATSLAGVWAAGDCAEVLPERGASFVEQLWYSAKRQGELAARAMLGDPVSYQPPIFYNSAKFFDIEYTTVGSVVDLPAGAVSYYYRIPRREASIRVAEANGAVIGFNMLGARWDHTYFERWIAERRSLEYVMERLPQAQFDVEFGREALSGARAALVH